MRPLVILLRILLVLIILTCIISVVNLFLIKNLRFTVVPDDEQRKSNDISHKLIQNYLKGDKKRNASLSLRAAIRPNENTIINDITCIKVPESTKILIMIQSAPTLSARRMASRMTWMRSVKQFDDVSALFIFGYRDNSTVDDEQRQHCDLIQMNFFDSYKNNTLDSLSAFKFALQFPFLDFVMISDDDSYINVEALRRALITGPNIQLKKDSQSIWGFEIYGKYPFAESPIKESEKLLLRFYDTQALYELDHYPSLVSGAGYVVPQDLIPCLYNTTMDLQDIGLNDVLITGISRYLCGFHILDNKNVFFNIEPFPPMISNDLILGHYVDQKLKCGLYRLFHVQKGDSSKCNKGLVCVDNIFFKYVSESKITYDLNNKQVELPEDALNTLCDFQ